MRSGTILFLIFLLAVLPAAYSQRPHRLAEITPSGKGIVDTRIDNIGYWNKMLRLGFVRLVPEEPSIRAVYTTSRITAPGIEPQDSPDIPVTGQTDVTQSENSVFIDPEDEEVVLNSNNSTNWINNYCQETYGADGLFSFNSGQTWNGSEQGAGQTNFGDPSTAIGLNGWWYVGKISNDGGQSVAYSKDQGQTWTNITVSPGTTTSYGILDKSHLWIDNSPQSPYSGYLYDAWTNLIQDAPDTNQIQISRSSDAGITWTSPLTISQAVEAVILNHGVNIQTGPDGKVYVAWSIYDTWPSDEKAIGFARSIDGGAIFAPAIRIIDNIKGNRMSLTSKSMRVNAFPSMAVDNSTGPNRGTIYLVWPNIGYPGINTGNDMDIYLIKSFDEGETWSSPIRVNQDPSGLGKQHFFPWITCDPVTGGLCVIYYDDRNVTATQCETFVSYSYDAGQSWTDMKVSDFSFTPSPIPGLAVSYFGDYLGIQSLNMKVYPIWTDNREGRAMSYVSSFDLGPNPGQPWITYYNYELSSIWKRTNQNMNYGDSLYLSLSLKNLGDQPATNVTATVSTPSPYILITDSIDFYGEMNPGEVKMISNGFSIKVSDTIPDDLNVRFNVKVQNSDTSWFSHFSIISHAPGLKIGGLTITDTTNGNGDGHLNPGETAELKITISNTGDFPCDSISASLAVDPDLLSLIYDSISLGNLGPGQIKQAIFQGTVHNNIPAGTGIDLRVETTSGNYIVRKTFGQIIGMITEDWETGNFGKFPWHQGGSAPWTITNINPYRGAYCAQSGIITDNHTSKLFLNYASSTEDSISFYVKTSTEADYDFLFFYIDSIYQGSWSGETRWIRVSFPVGPGQHQFFWSYEKDMAAGIGQDRVWIDDIVFPSPVLPEVNPGTDDTICTGQSYLLQGMASGYDSIKWTTSGDGSFSSTVVLNPLYTPGPDDINQGLVTLTLTAYAIYGKTVKSLTLTIGEIPVPVIVVFPKDTLCAGQTVYLSVDTTGNSSFFWTPGNFTGAEIMVDTSTTGGSGTTLFRVMVKNYMGCSGSDSLFIAFQDCSGVPESDEKFFVEVYPNPNNGIFNVRMRFPGLQKTTLRITDLTNMVLFQSYDLIIKDRWEKVFDFSALPAGIYLLSVDYEQGLIKHKVVILK